MGEIVELTTDAEFRQAWPVMRELRTHLDEGTFIEVVQRMRLDGYRLFALRDVGEIVALAGIAVTTNLYDLRHVWVYDLVTRADRRSEGHGKALLEWVEEFARSEGCARVSLSSGVRRIDAHRFYERKMGYERVSHVFHKAL